jgi:hypothetical protein
VFGTDSAGNILTAAWEPGEMGWRGWWHVGGVQTRPGGHVAAVSCEPDALDLFTIGLDGYVYHSFWMPNRSWNAWTRFSAADRRFKVGAPLAAVAESGRTIMIAGIHKDSARVLSSRFFIPLRHFDGFTTIGTRKFGTDSRLSLTALPNGDTHAYCIGQDGILYRAVRAKGLNQWTEWDAISSVSPSATPELPLNAWYEDGVTIYTDDQSDKIRVRVSENAVPVDRVEFVLKAGAGINWHKELVLVEGPSTGGDRTSLIVVDTINEARNGLFIHELAGGHLEFKKAKGFGKVEEVKRVRLDNCKPGTRTEFEWVDDT